MERKYTIRDLHEQVSKHVGDVTPEDYFEGQNDTPTEGDHDAQSFGTQAKAITSVAIINTDTVGDDGFIRLFVGLTDPGIDHSPQNGDLWFECDANRSFG